MKTRNVRIRKANRYMRRHMTRFTHPNDYPASMAAAIQSLGWNPGNFRRRKVWIGRSRKREQK